MSINSLRTGLLLACGLAASANAQTQWSGAVSLDWLTPGNWSPAVVPGLAANQNAQVLISPTSAANISAVNAPDLLTLSALRVTRADVTTRFVDTDVDLNDVYQHAGTMVLESASFRSRMRFRGIEMGGAGEIRLDGGAGQPSRAMLNLFNYPTVDQGTRIHGRGWIVGAFMNSGTVTADRAGDVLNMDPIQGDPLYLRNHGLMTSAQGGRLSIGTFEIDNAGGTFAADASDTEFRQGCDLYGGTLSTSHGGRILINGSVFESGVRFAGDVFVGGSYLLRFNFDNLHPTVQNSGTLHALNEGGGPVQALFNVRYSTTFTGGGTLSMDGRTGLWSEARFLDNGFQTVVTNAADHTFRGIGTFEVAVANQGRIRVGYAGEAPNTDQPTVLQFTKALTLAAGGTLEVPVVAGGAAGWLVSDQPLALGGRLRVVAEGGELTPHAGDSWDFIQAPAISGSFSSMDLPPLQGGLRWAGGVVQGGGNTVYRLSVVCGPDFNGDGFVDFFDYDDFVRCFETGQCPPGATADFNQDGFADFFDYDDFVATFEAGC